MWTIIKYNIQNLIINPVIILIYIIEVPVLLLLIFGVELNVENGIVTSLTILGRNIDEIGVFINFIIPNMLSVYIFIHIFLYIISTASITQSIINSPIASIILTKNITREKYVVSQYISYNLFIFLHLLILGILIFVILYFKTGVPLLKEIFIPCLRISILMSSYTMIFSLLGVIINNETFIAAVGIIFLFYLSSRITNITIEDGLLFNIIKYLFPPILAFEGYNKSVDIESLEYTGDYALDLFRIVFNLFYILVYISITILIYKKKDLS